MKALFSTLLCVTFPVLGYALPVVPLKAPKLFHQTHFFEESAREDLAPEQAPFLVQIHLSAKAVAASIGRTDQVAIDYMEKYLDGKPTCSAFFVRNKENKMFVGSSRHCFLFDETKLIANKEVTVRDFVTKSEGILTRIVVSDPLSDMFIFEVDFGANTEKVQKSRSSLIVALGAPSQNEALRVYGFPADPDRDRAPTLSTNCGIFPSDYDQKFSKYFIFSLTDGQKQDSSESAKKQGQMFADQTAMGLIYQNLRPLKHNCNIYGGNSGGPAVLVSFPEFLIGIPITYLPDAKALPRDNYGLLETAYWLITNQKEAMDREGILYQVAQ